MGDKFDGLLAGSRLHVDMDITDAMQNLTVHETLVTTDEHGSTVLLRAVQNPVAGGIMMVQEESQDHSQVMLEAIRRSQMTSMLADEARCSKYSDAIGRVLQKHQGATVLDIGTGTGLLAMLAAKAGASHVIAIEMFEPLADLAVRIVQANNLQENISVICASSTDISAGNRGDNDEYSLRERADVLVTEIFDSALLGESCLPAIKHAHRKLLKDGAIVIPARARIYARVISSDFFSKFQNLGHHFSLHRDDTSWHCESGSNGIPVHLDGLTEDVDYEVLTDPFEVFEFDFTKPDLPQYRQRSKQVARTKTGRPDAILMWWELDLTESGDIVYSTRAGAENWQDHWLQVVYPLPEPEHMALTGSTIAITMEHDERSLSFAHGLNTEPSVYCRCGLHSTMTPYRIHEVGDLSNLESLSSRIREAIAKTTTSNTAASDKSGVVRCLDVSDSSVCAVLAGRIQHEKRLEIYSVEEDNEISSFLFSQIAVNSKARSNDVFVEYDPLSAFIKRELQKRERSATWEGFDIVMSEPFTRAMHAYPIATLGNLMVQRLALSELLKDDFTMVPFVGRIQAQLVCFPRNTIQSSFKTIENVQGLDLHPYSRLLQEEDWDQSQRRLSLPLFQYNVIPRSTKSCILSVDFCAGDNDFLPNSNQSWIGLNEPGEVDAVTFCVEYDEIPARRTARYEVIWLSETEKRKVSKTGGVSLACEFLPDTGSWAFHLEAPQGQ